MHGDELDSPGSEDSDVYSQIDSLDRHPVTIIIDIIVITITITIIIIMAFTREVRPSRAEGRTERDGLLSRDNSLGLGINLIKVT